ncbi:unnamed protein product [Ceratitis capitata]|uniref:(Mediterranean fruit fly) hypothetical protein n=1 Tax=Ceratitis capitata TaxID=7213 RepID=A0A811UFS3_CERCA|nr:unnamed protein product [Ceratitis capitata]
MQRVTNYRKQNESLDEPLPKRIKSSKCDETEEWNFWDIIRVDDKIYHPLCYENHKGTFFKNPALNADDDKNDKKTEGATTVGNIDADDYVEVIVLPNQTPSLSANDNGDKDVSESLPTSEKATIDFNLDDESIMKYREHDDCCTAHADSSEADIDIQEPRIPFVDLDTYDNDEDEDDGFGDIGIMSPTGDRSPSSQSPEQVDATKCTEGSAAVIVVIAPTELNISIDGNPSVKPMAVLGKKIKINLAKSSMMVNNNSSNNRQPTPPPKPPTLPLRQEETPTFELKPALQGAKLRTMNTVKCGAETSGLCSVM